MKHFEYSPNPMVCCKKITFDVDEENRIHNLVFTGGCNGNLKAISKLCEGENAIRIISLLQGNTCGMRPTSCADQLTKAIEAFLN